MSEFQGRPETLDWVEKKAEAIWEMAGGLESFTEKFTREQIRYSAPVKVGGEKTERLAIHCTGKRNMREDRLQIVVPRGIVRAWNEMGVDYKSEKGVRGCLFRSRPYGGAKTEDAQWCLYLAGEEQWRIWAEHIAEAVGHLESRE